MNASSFMNTMKQTASKAATSALPKAATYFSGMLKKELTNPDFGKKYSESEQQDIWNAITTVCEVKKNENLSSRFTRVMKKSMFGSSGGRRTRRKSMKKSRGRKSMKSRRRKSMKTRGGKRRKSRGRKSMKTRGGKRRKSRGRKSMKSRGRKSMKSRGRKSMKSRGGKRRKSRSRRH